MTKKKVVKKKVSKKTTEVVVRIETPTIVTPKDLAPDKVGNKYVVPQTWVSEKQVLHMVQKTPAQHVYKRPGKGGQVFEYVTGHYVTKVLNLVFGWMWDFEIVTTGREGDQVWVQGKLSVKDMKGNLITKSQFGRADIKFLKGTKNPVDYGNDLKAASTDCLKKCASLLGVASDIYGKQEMTDSGKRFVDPTDTVHVAPSGVLDGEQIYTCKNCDSVISEQEAKYSKKMYGKELCRDCQKTSKKK